MCPKSVSRGWQIAHITDLPELAQQYAIPIVSARRSSLASRYWDCWRYLAQAIVSVLVAERALALTVTDHDKHLEECNLYAHRHLC